MDTLKNIAIILLSITTITFAALFLTYYNNIDRFMKDKENDLSKKEMDLAAREKTLRDCEKCMDNETEFSRILKSIQDLSQKGLTL